MLKSKLLPIAENTILILSQVFIGYLAVMSLLFQTHIQFGHDGIYPYEFAIISKQSFQTIIYLTLGFIGFLYLKVPLTSASPKRLFCSFSCVYALIATFLIFNTSNILSDDAFLIWQSAKELNSGIIKSLSNTKFFYSTNTAGYLYMHPHQLGLTFIESLLMLISENPRFLFLLNFLCIILTNFFLWKLVELVSHKNKVASNYTIVISFLFLPQLFFILFAYGTIPANMLIVTSLYYFVKITKQPKLKYIIAHATFLALAVLIKKNSLIAVLAFAILFTLEFIRNRKKIILLPPIIAIALIFSSSFLVKQYYQQKIGIELNHGVLMKSYIAMGISDDNITGRLGGWWNAVNNNTYQNISNKKTLNKFIDNDITGRIKEFKQDPTYTIKFFTQKIISMWSDPLFQSIWSTPLQKQKDLNNKNEIIKDLSSAGPIYKKIRSFSNLIMLIIYACSFLYLFTTKKINNLLLFSFLYFLGGFLFHIVWEAKGQYAITYVVTLIPTCALFLSQLTPNKKVVYTIKNIAQQIKQKSFLLFNRIASIKINNKILYIFLIALQMCICIYFAHQKKSFYCDEIFTYGLSNSEDYTFMDRKAIAKNYPSGWITKDFYDNYTNVNKNKPFSFKASYHNQEIDVHPPLHYMLVHIASLFTDNLSKWPGIILNLIILLLFDFVFFYIAHSLFKNKITSILSLALFTLSSAGLSNILYIRMYFLLTFTIVSYTAIHIHIIKENKISIISLALLFSCMIIGGLTHYYFYIFAFLASLFFGIYLLFKNRLWDLWYYGASLLGGFIFNVNVFPVIFKHIFIKDRGLEVIEKINNYGNFWFEKCFSLINQHMFAGYLYIIIPSILFVIMYTMPKYPIKKIKQTNLLFCFILYIYLTSTLCIIGISHSMHRFIYPLYPFIAILALYGFNFVYEKIKVNKIYYNLISVIITCLLIIFSIKKYSIDFQYLDYPLALKKLEMTQNYDALVLYDQKWIEEHYTIHQLKKLYDETYFFDKADLPNMHIITQKRKTKNPIVIIIHQQTENKIFIIKNIIKQLKLKNYQLLTTYQKMQFFLIE